MRNLSRRLQRLEAALPPPEDGADKHCSELIERLSFVERDALKDALGNLKDSTATEEDQETIRSLFKLAQERLDTGLIIVRERKPPEQWNREMREALRVQRETGGPWPGIYNYNEFLIRIADASTD